MEAYCLFGFIVCIVSMMIFSMSLEKRVNGLNRKLAYSKRIKELQEQQFTKEELQFIKNRLDECIEEWDVPDMVFMAHQILKKIEQTLKNLEGNLNKQQ